MYSCITYTIKSISSREEKQNRGRANSSKFSKQELLSQAQREANWEVMPSLAQLDATSPGPALTQLERPHWELKDFWSQSQENSFSAREQELNLSELWKRMSKAMMRKYLMDTEPKVN